MADGGLSLAIGGAVADWARPTEFRASSVLGSGRYKELDRRQSYFDCTQHDYKKWDFDGRILQPQGNGALSTMPMISSERYGAAVPLRSRRPSAPYRLGRIIVNAFTNLTFGQKRFPGLRVDGDSATQDWMNAVAKVGKLPTKMIQARNLGGAVGTVGMSWCFDRRGKPRFESHNAKHLYVHEWEDRESLIPAHLTEVYIYPKDEWDGSKRKFVRNWYWFRRDWTPEADLAFADILYVHGIDPEWPEADMNASVQHGHGECHFQWIQNLPSDEADGLPDYDGLYETFDSLDVLLSIIMRGAILNLDPTLVLKVEPETLQASVVRKGSDNSLVIGAEGSAEYLELGGSSIDSGLKLFESSRRSALETAQCIIPDPADVAANGASSVAQKMIYAPMLGKGDILREQYGEPIERMLMQMADFARSRQGATVTVPRGDGTEEDVRLTLDLPPRVDRVPDVDEETGEPALDELGKPIERIVTTERTPGEGGDVDLVWPGYFPPTPDDQQKALTTLTAASGAKPVLSQQTATEMAAAAVGVDPTEEWARVQKMGAADKAHEATQASAFGASGDFMGGKVGSQDELPPGASPTDDTTDDSADDSTDDTANPGSRLAHLLPGGGTQPTPASPPPAAAPPAPAQDDPETGSDAAPTPKDTSTTPKGDKAAPASTIQLTGTDLASIVTVNEARGQNGLGDLMLKDTGEKDPDGFLTVSEFRARKEAAVAADVEATAPLPKSPQR